MKQIGNLAVVCARRQNVLLQVGSEKVWVHVGAGPERDPKDKADTGRTGSGVGLCSALWCVVQAGDWR